MEKEFIPYEKALALKELGFDEPCLGFYKNDNLHYSSSIDDAENFRLWRVKLSDISILAPLYQQAFRWFRDKYGYDISLKKFTPSEYKFEIEELSTKKNNYHFLDGLFLSYEEAELACLIKLIEIVKNK